LRVQHREIDCTYCVAKGSFRLLTLLHVSNRYIAENGIQE
jgi:hypothetical protein